MKAMICGGFYLLAITLNAQIMTSPEKTVIGLFVATDQNNWQKVEDSFGDEVLLDYSSMNGSPAARFSASQIVASWKTILPGFEHTHHQIGNIQSKEMNEVANVSCYGTASHYLTNEEGNLWTVVGSYNFELVKKESKWEIVVMKFDFKFQDGNTSLPELAIKNVK